MVISRRLPVLRSENGHGLATTLNATRAVLKRTGWPGEDANNDDETRREGERASAGSQIEPEPIYDRAYR